MISPSWAWIFSRSGFYRNNEEFTTKLSGIVRQKIFDRKLWYPILMLKIFRNPIFSETQKGVHLRSISVLWQKTYSTDNLVTPTAPLHRNFDKRVFLKHRTFHLQRFLLSWDKKFSNRNSWHPALMHKFFRYPNFSQTPKGSAKSFCGSVKQNNIDWKWCYLLPSLIPNVFRHPK